MNEMHEYGFKSFQKHLFPTQNFKNKIFTFDPKISTNEYILYQNHRIYNLRWPNQIRTQFYVQDLVKTYL